MFHLRRIPVLRVLIPFFGGVVIGTVVFPAIQIRELVFVSLLGGLSVVILYALQGRRPEPAKWLLSPLLFLLFFVTGYGSSFLSRPVDPGMPIEEWVVIRGEVTGSPQAGKYAHSFDLELQMLCSARTIRVTKTNLKVYLNDSVMPVPGEIWQFSGKLVPYNTLQ